MAGFLWKSFRRCFGTSVHESGGSSMEEMVQDGVSKAHWSEILGDVHRRDDDDDDVTSIERSKVHWSEVPNTDSEVLAELEIQERNQTSLKSLQERDPFFFQDWSELVQVGPKIAEGGQAEIFEAIWTKLVKSNYKHFPGVDMPQDLVLKVFKLEGCSLEDFTRQWPHIAPTAHELFVSAYDTSMFLTSYRRSTYVSPVVGAFMMEDRRFAFLIERYRCDLRSCIDTKMRDNNGYVSPFLHCHELDILLCIAKGMQWLHSHGVLHRDLKASNVLMEGSRSLLARCVIADYECSVFTVGTGFWRAPEVLQAMIHRSGESGDIWTTKSDVYSFGMTCFEVLTGGVPFPRYSKADWPKIIEGERPQLPDFVDFELQQLVRGCWDKDPSKRPSFDDIVQELVLGSRKIKSNERSSFEC